MNILKSLEELSILRVISILEEEFPIDNQHTN